MKNYMLLSETEKQILESYSSVLDRLSEYLGIGYEFVLHSLENLEQSAIKVINGHYSNRETGAPITDLALSYLSKFNEDANYSESSYFNVNANGVSTHSTTIPIFGDKKRIIGLLCINFYLDTPFSDIIKKYTHPDVSKNFASETYVSNTEELIDSTLERVKFKVYNDCCISSVNKNKEIIAILYEQGIFNFKDAVLKVATNLTISKNTVYMHIRNLSADEH